MKRILLILCIGVMATAQVAAQNIRINAGGGAVTTASGDSYAADNYFSGGEAYTNPSITSIGGTVDDALYINERNSGLDLAGLSYSIPVSNGTYLVRLHFAELFHGAPGGGAGGAGKRVFDVTLESSLEINNLDLNAIVGSTTAYIADIVTTISDDTLNIDFAPSVNRPQISAIEVLTIPAGQLYPIPSVAGFGDQPENQTSDPVSLKLFNNTGSTVNITAVSITGPDQNEFTHNFSGPDSVANNDCYTINITMTPYKTGSATATLSILSDASGSPLQLAISGRGVEDCVWQTKANAIQNRFIASSAASDSLLYVFGGFKGLQQVVGLLEAYDPYGNTWTQLDSMPLAVSHNPSVIIDNQIWTAGGFIGNSPGPATDSVQIYDIATNTWSFGPKLPLVRSSMGMAVVGRKIHVFGGLAADRNSNVGDHWAYDVDNPGAGWVSLSAMPNPRNHFGTAVVAGKIYAIGGQLFHDFSPVDTNLVDCYDPVANSWTNVSAMPANRSHIEGSTFDYNECIYTAGGKNGALVVDDMYKYNVQNDTWEVSCNIPQKLQGPSAKLIGNKIVLSGGGINGITNLSKATYCREVTPVYTCGVPTGFAADSTGLYTAHLSWDAAVTAPGFSIRYTIKDSANYTMESPAGSSNNSHVLTGLLRNTTYQAQIRSNCFDSISDWSAVIEFTTDSFTCSVPQNVRVISSTPGTITVKWDNTSTAPAFRVKYNTTGMTDYVWVTAAGSPNQTHTITGLFANTSYDIQVNSLCVGNFSFFSAPISATTDSGYTCSKPKGVAISNMTATTALVSWNYNGTAPSYTIRYRAVGSGTYLYAYAAGYPNNSYILTGLSGSTDYEVWVRSVCPGSVSEFSTVANFTTAPYSCTVPTGVQVIGTTAGSITIGWDSVSTAPAFRVKYNTTGMTNYIWLTASGTPNQTYTITGLFANTSYDIQVNSLCVGNFSAFSPPVTAVTDSGYTCSKPKGVTVTNLTPTTAKVSWDYNGTAPKYTLRYREVGSGTYLFAYAAGYPNNTHTLTGLKPSTNYEVRVRSVCPGNVSVFSTIIPFTTTPYSCTVPSDVQVTGTTAGTITIAWDSSSTAPAFRVKYNRTGMTDYVWVTAAGTPNQTHTITGLYANTSYDIQVNSLCVGNFSAFSAPIIGVTDTGYTCSQPKGVTVSNITPTTALISWNNNGTAPNYTLRFRPVSGGAYSYAYAAGFPNTSHTITGLSDSTEYQVQVRSVCSGSVSAFSTNVIFTTDTFNCNGPSITTVKDLFPWKATVVWDSLSSAPGYRLRINRTGFTDYKWYTVGGYPNRMRTINNLVANTSYDVVIKSLCPGNFSAFSSPYTFVTPSSVRFAGSLGNGTIVVSPNPIADEFQINFGNVEGKKLVSVHDITGKLLFEKLISGDHTDLYTIDSSKWPGGIYTVSVSVGNEAEHIKVVKE